MSSITTCPQCAAQLVLPTGAAETDFVRCPECNAEFSLAEGEFRPVTAAELIEPPAAPDPEVPQTVLPQVTSPIEPAAAGGVEGFEPLASTKAEEPAAATTPAPESASAAEEHSPEDWDPKKSEAETIVSTPAGWEARIRNAIDATATPEKPKETISFAANKTVEFSPTGEPSPEFEFHMDPPQEKPADHESVSPASVTESAEWFQAASQENIEQLEPPQPASPVAEPTPTPEVEPAVATSVPPRTRRTSNSLLRLATVFLLFGVVGTVLGQYALFWLRGPSADFLGLAKWTPSALMPGATSQLLAPQINTEPALAQNSTDQDSAVRDLLTADAPDQGQANSALRQDTAVTPAAAELPLEKSAQPIALLPATGTSPAEFATLLSEASQLGSALLVGDLPSRESKRDKGAAYMALCQLAAAWDFSSTSSAGQGTETEALYRRLALNQTGRESIAYIGRRWWQHDQRPHQGCVLVGRVANVTDDGSLKIYDLELAASGQPATIPVVSAETNIQPGANVCVVGTIISDSQPLLVPLSANLQSRSLADLSSSSKSRKTLNCGTLRHFDYYGRLRFCVTIGTTTGHESTTRDVMKVAVPIETYPGGTSGCLGSLHRRSVAQEGLASTARVGRGALCRLCRRRVPTGRRHDRCRPPGAFSGCRRRAASAHARRQPGRRTRRSTAPARRTGCHRHVRSPGKSPGDSRAGRHQGNSVRHGNDPRITRAQSMDVLSSMATVAGYKAVMLAANHLPKLFPMLMTAAGTLVPAKVLVIGAGVAGLQAIASARRLGAIVQAYDVRPVVKEQIESLGGKFVELNLDTADSEDAGGYAKQLTEAASAECNNSSWRRSWWPNAMSASPPRQFLANPPRCSSPKTPWSGMRPRLGDCRSGSRAWRQLRTFPARRSGCGKRSHDSGPTNLPGEVPQHASQMYAKNLVTFLDLLVKEGEIDVDLGDEVIRDTLAAKDGQVQNERLRGILGLGAFGEGTDVAARRSSWRMVTESSNLHSALHCVAMRLTPIPNSDPCLPEQWISLPPSQFSLSPCLLASRLSPRCRRRLHTPLMSGSNAISGITLVGALLAGGGFPERHLGLSGDRLCHLAMSSAASW